MLVLLLKQLLFRKFRQLNSIMQQVDALFVFFSLKRTVKVVCYKENK